MGTPAGGEFSMIEHRTVAVLYFIVGKSNYTCAPAL